MLTDPLARLRGLCMELPEVSERLNHGEPSWTVRRKTFVQCSACHPADRMGFWSPAPAGAREALTASDPERYFVPPYGGDGWLGVYLDVPVSWTEIREIIIEAYHVVAPKNSRRGWSRGIWVMTARSDHSLRRAGVLRLSCDELG